MSINFVKNNNNNTKMRNGIIIASNYGKSPKHLNNSYERLFLALGPKTRP